MEGSWRVEGGFSELTRALEERISPTSKQLNTKVTMVTLRDGVCIATLDDGTMTEADQIVLAMPPRVAARLRFVPEIPDESASAMAAVPTWMAGQAKVVAIYDTAFWRDLGLSGDAMSRRGPLVEIHDASPARGGPYALFGFVGIPPKARSNRETLCQAAQAQLIRLFGASAAQPEAVLVKDWAFDPLTSTQLDRTAHPSHPANGLPEALKGLWEERLIFASAEVAPNFGGYIEGALEAADAALRAVQR